MLNYFFLNNQKIFLKDFYLILLKFYLNLPNIPLPNLSRESGPSYLEFWHLLSDVTINAF